jgi:hypothetical protein
MTVINDSTQSNLLTLIHLGFLYNADRHPFSASVLPLARVRQLLLVHRSTSLALEFRIVFQRSKILVFESSSLQVFSRCQHNPIC